MRISRWSVWLAGLDPVIGSEQGKTRPVLVVSRTDLNQILPVVCVLPVTSRKPGRRIYPNEALLPSGSATLRESIVLTYQVRTLDKQRLVRHLGDIDDAQLQNAVLEAFCFYLEIPLNYFQR